MWVVQDVRNYMKLRVWGTGILGSPEISPCPQSLWTCQCSATLPLSQPSSLLLATDNLLATVQNLCSVFLAQPCDRKSHGRSTAHIQGPQCQPEHTWGSQSLETPFPNHPYYFPRWILRPPKMKSLSKCPRGMNKPPHLSPHLCDITKPRVRKFLLWSQEWGNLQNSLPVALPLHWPFSLSTILQVRKGMGYWPFTTSISSYPRGSLATWAAGHISLAACDNAINWILHGYLHSQYSKRSHKNFKYYFKEIIQLASSLIIQSLPLHLRN